MTAGQKIREFRTRQGLSQRELGKKARMVRDYISKLETGEKNNPKILTLKRLADALGVQLKDLF